MEYYATTIKKSVDYIEKNLSSGFTIGDLSKESGYSAYHFQRLFKAVVGESVKDYIRKRRLTVAANRLKSTDRRIIEIAIDAGFESQEAFSRAFKKVFQVAPHQFRQTSQTPYFFGRRPIDQSMLKQLVGNYCLEPEVVTWSKRSFIGAGRAFPKDFFEDVAQFWREFSEITDQIPNVISEDTFGICFGHNDQIKTPGDTELVYIAALEVKDSDTLVPEGMLIETLPERTYLKFAHQGPLERFQDTLDYVWGFHLPRSGYARIENPDIELYPAGFDPTAESVKIELFIPIE